MVGGRKCFLIHEKQIWRLFPEKIYHPEDDNGHDLFIPFKKVDPSDPEIIKKEKKESLFLKRGIFDTETQGKCNINPGVNENEKNIHCLKIGWFGEN